MPQHRLSRIDDLQVMNVCGLAIAPERPRAVALEVVSCFSGRTNPGGGLLAVTRNFPCSVLGLHGWWARRLGLGLQSGDRSKSW